MILHPPRVFNFFLSFFSVVTSTGCAGVFTRLERDTLGGNALRTGRFTALFNILLPD